MDNRGVRGRVASERFVGREGELEALGEDSGAVVIAGDAGVGKSRLVAELERRATADGKFVLVGECLELTDGELPYAGCRERAARRAPPRPRRRRVHRRRAPAALAAVAGAGG